MVEAFKTINTKNGNQETVYAVMGEAKKSEALKAVASYKKERLDKVQAKFKKITSGYVVVRKGEFLLYEADENKLPVGARKCMIVRR